MNKRKEIRSALKELLEVDPNFSDTTIITSRSGGISQTEELPSVTILTPNEPVQAAVIGPKGRYIRRLMLVFEARLDATSNVDDQLDDLSNLIESFMVTNDGISGLVQGSVLVDSNTEVGYEGNREIGLATLEYEVTYIS